MNSSILTVDEGLRATLGLRGMFYLVSGKELASNAQDIIGQAYIWFVVLIVAEFIVGKLRGHKTYRLNDGVSSIAMGMVSEQTKLWGKAAIFYLYEHIYQEHGLVVFDNATSWPAFLFAMFMVDFFYYWFHRFCHEFHFAFTQHSVHHSGEDYNLATALRQGAFQWIIGFTFTLPLALIIPPKALFGHFFANTLAQFWFHTSQVGDLGLLEYILNTPSAHRMHHRPPGNCNYGGVLIVFDKVFGTYIGEREHLDYYGLAKQYETFDPVWASVEHGARVMHNVDKGEGSMASLLKRRVKHKWVFEPLGLFRAPPKPEAGSLWTMPTKSYRKKLDAQLPWVLNVYLLVLFVFQLLMFLRQSELLKSGQFTLDAQLVVRQGLSLWAMSSMGRLFDGFSKGRASNLTRVLATPLIVMLALEPRGIDAVLYQSAFVDFALFVGISMSLVGSKH